MALARMAAISASVAAEAKERAESKRMEMILVILNQMGGNVRNVSQL